MDRVTIDNPLRFKGSVTVDVDTSPLPVENGDIYINDSDCVAGASWTGIVGKFVGEAFALGWAEDTGRWYVIGDLNIDVEQMKKEAAAMATPVGTIDMWMGQNAPSGYFLCQGGTFDINTNPILHTFLSTNFSGYASGELPDYRGYFPGGHGDLGMSGDLGGKTDASTGDPGLSVVSNGSHNHTATTTASTSVTIGGGGTVDTSSAGSHRHNVGFHKNKDNNTSNSGSSVNVTTEYHNNGSEFTRATNEAGGHEHEVDLSGITASGSTTANTTIANAGDHSHSLSGWDTRTMPNAFAINFIIRHDY